MKYAPIWSPQHVPPRPHVETRKDSREYIDLCTVNHEKLYAIINYMAEHQPGKLETITSDGFIEQLSRQFGATITLPRAAK